MDMFDKNGDDFEIITDERTAFSTAANLLMLLTTEQTFSTTLAFPDVPKTEIYGWSFTGSDNPVGPGYVWGATGQSFVGVHPQEWSDIIVLGSIPPGANFHMGRGSFDRTGDPSHDWWSYPLPVRIPTGVEIQIAGSFLLEAAPGFSRKASIYIPDGSTELPGPEGYLVAFLKQSVGAGAGNFDAWGATDIPAIGNVSGGDNSSTGGASIPVYRNDSSPYRKVGSGTASSRFLANDAIFSYKNGGFNEAAFADPTDYSSTYSLTVKTRFGRLNS